MNITMAATKLRKNLFKLIEQVEKPGNTITITVDGEPKIIMMSVEDYEGWVETLEIMSDKELMKGIEEGMKDLKEGRFYTEEEFYGKFYKKSKAAKKNV